jgi:hypothetical protein
VRDGHLAADGGDVHDPAVPARPHVRQDGQRGAHGPPEDDGHRALEIGQPHRLLRAHLDGARVVHQQIDPAEALERPFDQDLDGGGLADVAANGQHLDPAPAEVVRGPPELVRIARAENELAAGPTELARDERAQAARAPGDDRHLTRQAAPPGKGPPQPPAPGDGQPGQEVPRLHTANLTPKGPRASAACLLGHAYSRTDCPDGDLGADVRPSADRVGRLVGAR